MAFNLTRKPKPYNKDASQIAKEAGIATGFNVLGSIVSGAAKHFLYEKPEAEKQRRAVHGSAALNVIGNHISNAAVYAAKARNQMLNPEVDLFKSELKDSGGTGNTPYNNVSTRIRQLGEALTKNATAQSDVMTSNATPGDKQKSIKNMVYAANIIKGQLRNDKSLRNRLIAGQKEAAKHRAAGDMRKAAAVSAKVLRDISSVHAGLAQARMTAAIDEGLISKKALIGYRATIRQVEDLALSVGNQAVYSSGDKSEASNRPMTIDSKTGHLPEWMRESLDTKPDGRLVWDYQKVGPILFSDKATKLHSELFMSPDGEQYFDPGQLKKGQLVFNKSTKPPEVYVAVARGDLSMFYGMRDAVSGPGISPKKLTGPIASIQKALGISVDGAWGKETQKAMVEAVESDGVLNKVSLKKSDKLQGLFVAEAGSVSLGRRPLATLASAGEQGVGYDEPPEETAASQLEKARLDRDEILKALDDPGNTEVTLDHLNAANAKIQRLYKEVKGATPELPDIDPSSPYWSPETERLWEEIEPSMRGGYEDPEMQKLWFSTPGLGAPAYKASKTVEPDLPPGTPPIDPSEVVDVGGREIPQREMEDVGLPYDRYNLTSVSGGYMLVQDPKTGEHILVNDAKIIETKSGLLETTDGMLVLGRNGGTIMGAGEGIDIDENGRVTIKGDPKGQLGLISTVNVENPDGLEKTATGFKVTDASGPITGSSGVYRSGEVLGYISEEAPAHEPGPLPSEHQALQFLMEASPSRPAKSPADIRAEAGFTAGAMGTAVSTAISDRLGKTSELLNLLKDENTNVRDAVVEALDSEENPPEVAERASVVARRAKGSFPEAFGGIRQKVLDGTDEIIVSLETKQLERDAKSMSSYSALARTINDQPGVDIAKRKLIKPHQLTTVGQLVGQLSSMDPNAAQLFLSELGGDDEGAKKAIELINEIGAIDNAWTNGMSASIIISRMNANDTETLQAFGQKELIKIYNDTEDKPTLRAGKVQDWLKTKPGKAFKKEGLRVYAQDALKAYWDAVKGNKDIIEEMRHIIGIDSKGKPREAVIAFPREGIDPLIRAAWLGVWHGASGTARGGNFDGERVLQILINARDDGRLQTTGDEVFPSFIDEYYLNLHVGKGNLAEKLVREIKAEISRGGAGSVKAKTYKRLWKIGVSHGLQMRQRSKLESYLRKMQRRKQK